MKKIIIFLTVVVIGIALLPMMGNKVVEQELSNRLDVLVSYGVEVKEESLENSYFSSSKHYELKVIDGAKFSTYIQQFSDSQLPPYVDSMIEGVTIGSDVKYSNFPLSDGVSVDIYPLTFSTKFIQSITKKDKGFFKYLDNLLQSKGILYHINYKVLQSDFDGYIKDIDESYTLEDATKMSIKLSGSHFNGEGLLLAPDRIDSKIKYLSLDIERSKESLHIVLDEWDSTSNFASASTFAYGGKIKSLSLRADGTVLGKVDTKIENMALNFSSNTQEKKAEFYSKSSFDSFKIAQADKKFRVGGFNYDIVVKDVEKDALERFRVLLVKAKTDDSLQMQKKIQDSFSELLSKGLELHVADLSVNKIDYKTQKNIDGFTLRTDLLLPQDDDLVNNLQTNPSFVAKNIDLNTTLKVSKQMFSTIVKEVPLAMLAKAYAKEEKEELIYKFILKDGKLSVNDQLLR